MRVVILAGGKGTRLSEETLIIPKPMLPVGDVPILVHIMGIYNKYGHKEFIIAAGHKKQHIIAYFLSVGAWIVKAEYDEGLIEFAWNDVNIKVVDTGEDTMTGGRLKRLIPYLNRIEPFLMTYGDGLCSINVDRLVRFHDLHPASVTLTAVRPVPRFGSLNFDGNGKVQEFSEKIVGRSDWINGGFFVIEPEALDYVQGDETNWEKDVLPSLAGRGELYAYRHEGFWHCIDTQRDLELIREEYEKRGAFWLSGL